MSYLIIIEEVVKVLYKGHIVYVVIELPQRKEARYCYKSPLTDFGVKRRSDDIYRLSGRRRRPRTDRSCWLDKEMH